MVTVLALLAGALTPPAFAASTRSGDGPTAASGFGGSSVRSCPSLLLLRFTDGTKVTSAVDVPATPVAPAFCSVTLLIPNRINVVVGLPTTNWNGRFVAFGGSGFDGAPLGVISARAPLAQGYVTSASDHGHTGTTLNGEFAYSPTGLNNALIRDHAYRASHEMAVKTKSLIRSFYGRAPSRSYFNGCSNGGRQALEMAKRYPNEFDGVVAMSPGINWTRLLPAMLWPPLVMKWANHYLPGCKEAALRQALVQACGTTGDGSRSGLIDPNRCTFDARTLIGVETPCGDFTAADAALINRIWQGPRGPEGEFLWFGLDRWSDIGNGAPLVLGATVSAPAGTVPSSLAVDAVPATFPVDWFKYFVHENPMWDWHNVTYQQFVADFRESVRKWADPYASDSVDLRAFKARGGKLLLWHGLGDQLIPSGGVIQYYERLVRAQGGRPQTESFARLFLSPNSPHCSTQGLTEPNIGPYPTDTLAAVVAWRETGKAPATLAGRGTDMAGRPLTRNVCPYPQRMRYRGTGSVLQAASYTCSRS